MSDYNDLVRHMKAKPSTAIIQFPSGRYGFVGSVPAALCHPSPTSIYHVMTSNAYDTAKEAIEALLSVGVTRFQVPGGAWYEAQS